MLLAEVKVLLNHLKFSTGGFYDVSKDKILKIVYKYDQFCSLYATWVRLC